MTETKREPELHPARDYKARLFEMIFSDKKELLGLYNAMNGTDYHNPEELEINTLHNAIYLSMHNDISFIIGSRVMLYEQQSTYSLNLPLRYLLYIADLYSEITKNENVYGSKMVKIPAPRFVIFYNGEDVKPEKEWMNLSDVYTIRKRYPMLELKAEFVNINPGYNEALLNGCKTLREYSEYTARVRGYSKSMGIEAAVERAITECIHEGILEEFLRKNRAEAKKVSIYEYDEQRQRRFDRAEGREEGRAEGREEGRVEGEKRYAELMQILLGAGKVEEAKKVAGDAEYRKSLFEEYKL